MRKNTFSPDRVYRYTLWRDWGVPREPYAMFIGLNPSTADEVQDDPTVRRCIGFAKSWGYGSLCMTNIFAFRATFPSVMKAQDDPVGLENDTWLLRCAQEAGVIVAAWGTHGALKNRGDRVLQLLKDHDIMCLKVTRGGHPEHPLYLRADMRPMPYEWKK